MSAATAGTTGMHQSRAEENIEMEPVQIEAIVLDMVKKAKAASRGIAALDRKSVV